MNNTSISERIMAAREKLGISKAEAARRLNLTYIGYCRYEYGDRTPSTQTLELIAQCYGTSVDYLTGKTDDNRNDYLVVSRKDEPELFKLIEKCRSEKGDTPERLLAYLFKIEHSRLPQQ